ncbi:MAG: glycine zipper 2TM domain-containing protein [Epsilonproteobacteria bacterium]|nr:glycine zipper 2TM domain-containing protein [Campylobacterota bacterium]
MKKILLAILTASWLMAGNYGYDDNRVVPGLIGGIVGGVIGHQIGKGKGKTAATIGGAILGSMVGSAIAGERAGRKPRPHRYETYRSPRYDDRPRRPRRCARKARRYRYNDYYARRCDCYCDDPCDAGRGRVTRLYRRVTY